MVFIYPIDDFIIFYIQYIYILRNGFLTVLPFGRPVGCFKVENGFMKGFNDF